jgi:hypothetical protein
VIAEEEEIVDIRLPVPTIPEELSPSLEDLAATGHLKLHKKLLR